jgi:hypothetical protein
MPITAFQVDHQVKPEPHLFTAPAPEPHLLQIIFKFWSGEPDRELQLQFHNIVLPNKEKFFLSSTLA